MNLRTENWNGHSIRFVENEPGEWWAVLKDITDALDLRSYEVRRRLQKDLLSKHTLLTPGGPQEMIIINEHGIYKTIFQSRKKEAENFQDWTFEMLKQLRRASGLEGFQIFRMLDKGHQRAAMGRLNHALLQPVRVDFIMANTITNKTVSTLHGYPKAIKKNQMTPDMLVDRQPILDDTVELMALREKWGLNLSVSEAVNSKYLSH